ncbi:MAG: hypothetical protein ABIJ46_02180 [bacterium]
MEQNSKKIQGNKVLDLLNAALRHLRREPIRAAKEMEQANSLLLYSENGNQKLIGYAVAVSAIVVAMTERMRAVTIPSSGGSDPNATTVVFY